MLTVLTLGEDFGISPRVDGPKPDPLKAFVSIVDNKAIPINDRIGSPLLRNDIMVDVAVAIQASSGRATVIWVMTTAG